MIGRLLCRLHHHKPVEIETDWTALIWYHCARCGKPLGFLRRK